MYLCQVVHESDEDSESVISSCVSDIGSPAPSTPMSDLSNSGFNCALRSQTPSNIDTDSQQVRYDTFK